MTLVKSLWHGLLAGAAGTTARILVSAAAGPRGGGDDDGGDRDGGPDTGLGIGALGGVLRGLGVRPGAVTGSVTAGAGAMAADSALAAHGASDPTARQAAAPPRTVAGALPYLAYGAVTHATLTALEPRDAPVRTDGLPPRPAGAGLLARSALLGLAAGSRSSLGVAAPVLGRALRSDAPRAAGRNALADVDMADRAEVTLSALAPPPRPGNLAALLSVGGVAGELVIDKLPSTPDRLEGGGLGARLVSGATGSVVLCRQEDATSFWPAVAGGLGAFAGAHGAAAWREAAPRWMPDWQAALIEDAVALGAAAAATLTGRR